MKTISVRQLAAIKRVAQNVNLAVTRKNKLEEKIKELNNEYNSLVDEIEGHEVGIKALTGGHTSEELVMKVIKDTGKVDKDGKPIKTTTYEPIPTALKFNNSNKVYDLIIDEPEVDKNPVNLSEIDDSNIVNEESTNENELPWI